MAEATAKLADGLKHLAAGDLAYEITQPLPADFENLRTDFNAAVSQLRETLAAVAQAGSSIDSGSREISHSADDLSKRTEQQAASLEETAAALDEITVNVSNSSKRAEEARNVAIQANESARHSGTVVATAVDAMGKIEQSSGQISNIIGVIDDIAFQTNLWRSMPVSRRPVQARPARVLPSLPRKSANWRSARPRPPRKSRT